MIKRNDNEPRIGKQADNIFSKTMREDIFSPKIDESHVSLKDQPKKPIGRPKELPPDAIKSTVTLYNKQVVWLDRLQTSIRERSLAIVDRSTIIRALLSAIEQSNIDFTEATTEEGISHLLLQKLQQSE